jgi:hypothetical protein
MAGVLVLCGVCGLRAEPAVEVHDLFKDVARALSDRKADVVEGAFDASLPGYSKFRANLRALLRASDTQSTIELEKNVGDGQNRSVSLNWLLEITERGGSRAVTRRRARVDCQLKKKAGAWRIVSFAPADFFAPPQAEEAWNVLATAARGLTEAATPVSTNRADIPLANATKFMEAFDPAMPGYPQLKDNVLALEQGASVESSVDLLTNEGDDRVRTLALDWTLDLISPETRVAMVQRWQTVTCRMEKQGKKWRITALEPRAFFAPPAAGKAPLY